MPDKLRFIQIGCGGIGGSHLALLREYRGIDVVGVCDTDDVVLQPLRDARIPAFTDYRALLDAVRADCAVVSLPHFAYPEVVKLCLERNIHVLKEKPFARTLDDARDMTAAAEATGKILMVCGQAKHYPAFRRAKELLEAEAIGDVLVARGIITYRWGNAIDGTWSWRGEHAKSGGVAVIDSGWHILDLIHWYCGAPSRVSCMLGKGNALPGDYDVDDRAVLTLEFDNGTVAAVTCCFITQPSNRQVVLHGLEGAIDVTSERLVGTYADGKQEIEEFDEGSHTLEPQLEAFVAAVRSGSMPTSGAAEAYHVQRIIDAAYRSAEEGKAVSLRD